MPDPLAITLLILFSAVVMSMAVLFWDEYTPPTWVAIPYPVVLAARSVFGLWLLAVFVWWGFGEPGAR